VVISLTFRLEGLGLSLSMATTLPVYAGCVAFVRCDRQEEVDELWARLSAIWLNDRYGLTWQIVSSVHAGW
jgi:predicted 3-demethylubiquinone-9 3-methyltransferase (glyoxalase superfamily)